MFNYYGVALRREVCGLRIGGDIAPQTNLANKDGDAVVVASKIVSKAYERIWKLSDVKASPKARLLSGRLLSWCGVDFSNAPPG